MNEKRESAVQNDMDPSSVKPPDQTTVNIYHSALMSDPELTLRLGKEKPVQRDVAEPSVRSMLINTAGILFLFVCYW